MSGADSLDGAGTNAHVRGRLFDMISQAPGFAAYLHGPALVFERANEGYLQLVGRRDLVGKRVEDALPELAEQGLVDMLHDVYVRGEPFVQRGLAVRLGSSLDEHVLDFVVQPIRDDSGDVVGLFTQGADVTDVHRLASEKSAADERYRALFESIDEGFCIMQMILNDAGETVDYRFIATNAAFEAHTGLKDAVGKTARQLVPDLDPSWFQIYGEVAATGVPRRFENHAPAMKRWFDTYASRVGEPAARQVALLFKDVSARMQAEEERARLLELEKKARQDAEEASRLKDEFLATVSHELRTPLTAVLGWVQMLRTGSLSPDKAARALETIERNARAQAQLIDDLLDVSRILAGKLTLDIGPVSLGAVVEAALDSVRPAATAKEIRLQPTLATDGIVMGDARRLQQVVWNLLTNAVKFTPKGGRVQVVVEVLDSAVELTVSDTGRGIPASFLPHVFERFRQADASSTRAHGGLGLGLSIARQLVEMHGGTVSAESEGVDRGATFVVKLPLAVTRRRALDMTASDDRLRSAGITCPPELAGLRVLVVDDEGDTREMLRSLLEGCGADVTTAGSATEGLATLEQIVPDVLVSDIGMPEEDGYRFIERVRALPPERGGEVPAVALTAYARKEDRTRALLLGFHSHVPKPVEPLELLAVIASLSQTVRRRR